MARVKGAMMTRKRRNKTLKLAKGYWGNKSRHFKMANEQWFQIWGQSMDYKIVLMSDAEEDLDRFITYLSFEKKSE